MPPTFGNSAPPRRLVKGPQCDTCTLGQNITSATVINHDDRAFDIPQCFAGELDNLTEMPLTLCANRKVVERW